MRDLFLDEDETDQDDTPTFYQEILSKKEDDTSDSKLPESAQQYENDKYFCYTGITTEYLLKELQGISEEQELSDSDLILDNTPTIEPEASDEKPMIEPQKETVSQNED